MVGVIEIEADGEISVKRLYALFAHQCPGFLVDKNKKRDFNQLLTGLNEQGHFQRNQIENPGAVFHLFRQIAHLLDVMPAPYAFQINRLAAERIIDQ